MTLQSPPRVPGPCAVAIVDGKAAGITRLAAALGLHGIDLLCATSTERALSLLVERSPVILVVDVDADWTRYTMKLILRAHALVPAIQVLALTNRAENSGTKTGLNGLCILSASAPEGVFGRAIVELLVKTEAKRQRLRGRTRSHRPDLVDYVEFWLVNWVAKRLGVGPEAVDRGAPLSRLLADPRTRTLLATDCGEVIGAAVPSDMIETCSNLRELAQVLVGALESREGQT